tara:strand:- start:595 stop:774 length:180 start_codon:yes stop_codon:yes gene_type:complete
MEWIFGTIASHVKDKDSSWWFGSNSFLGQVAGYHADEPKKLDLMQYLPLLVIGYFVYNA